MRTIMKTTLLAVTALTLTAGIADAHPRAYVGGQFLGLCWTDGGLFTDLPSIGGTCWNANHVVPDALTGEATVSVTDLVVPSLGLFVCQDTNADVLCGDDVAGELSVAGCGSVTITDTAFGGTWASGALVPLWAFVDGLVTGAVASNCIGEIAPGTTGTATHS